MVSTVTGPVVNLPLRSAIAWSGVPGIGAAIVMSAVFTLASGMMGLAATGLAALGVFIGAGAGWVMLSMGGQFGGERSAGAWSLIIVYAQAARMMMALVVGGSLFFLLRPAVVPFWVTFLAMLLVMLAAEVVFSMKWIRSASDVPCGQSGMRNVHV